MVLATGLNQKGKLACQVHLQAPLIGEVIRVVNSANPSEKGLSGKVVDETRSTIKIGPVKTGSAGEIKTLLKKNIQFQVKSGPEPEKFGPVIEGKKLAKRLEERIKN